MSRAAEAELITVADLPMLGTVTVPTTARLLNISVDLAYDLAKRGELPCVSLGRRRLVIASRLYEMLAPAEATAGTGDEAEG